MILNFFPIRLCSIHLTYLKYFDSSSKNLNFFKSKVNKHLASSCNFLTISLTFCFFPSFSFLCNAILSLECCTELMSSRNYSQTNFLKSFPLLIISRGLVSLTFALGIRKIFHKQRVHKPGREFFGFAGMFIELCGSKVQLAPSHGSFSNS